MYTSLSIRSASEIFKLKRGAFFRAIISAIFLFSSISPLEAGGWGQTGQVVDCDGIPMTGFYFDLNGLSFEANVPLDSQTCLIGGNVSVEASIDGNILYVIRTPFQGGFKPHKNVKEFIKAIRTIFPDGDVSASQANVKKFGAKYIAEVTIKKEEMTIFWRCLATKDRLILMGTNDPKANRRTYFFDGIKIK